MADTGLGFTTVLTYNGYTFDSTAHIEVEEEAILDDAKRTVLYQQITITASQIFTASDSATLSSNMQAVRAQLNEPGRALTFKNAGFGDPLLVNQSSGGVRDLKFGPMPKVRTWQQIGASRAVECVWSVVVCVPTCNDVSSIRSSGLMAINYSVSTRIEDGYTTRVIAGYLQIAMTRMPGTKKIPDSADMYRSLVSPVKPPNFTREFDFTVSPDKSRLDFSVTDTEIRSDQAYPQFVIRPTGKHRISWRRGMYMLRLVGEISMELEMDQDHTQNYAWNVFYTIVKQRLQLATDANRAFLLQSLDIEEDIWGKASSFNLEYTFLTTPGDFMKDMLEKSGIWQPLGTDWTRWTSSLPQVFDPYGWAQMQNRPENDLIVDLCSQDKVQWGGGAQQSTLAITPPNSTFQNKKPDPKQSYLEYYNNVVPKVVTETQRQSVMQSSDVDNAENDPNGVTFKSRAYGGVDDIIQKSGRSQYSIELIGGAVRAGYPVPRPILTTNGAQKPEEAFFVMPQSIVGDWFGVPIYKASWRVVYMLPNAPGDFPIQQNPRENLDGNGQ